MKAIMIKNIYIFYIPPKSLELADVGAQVILFHVIGVLTRDWTATSNEIAQLSIWVGTCDTGAPITAAELSGNFVPMAQGSVSLSISFFFFFLTTWQIQGGPSLCCWSDDKKYTLITGRRVKQKFRGRESIYFWCLKLILAHRSCLIRPISCTSISTGMYFLKIGFWIHFFS